MSQYLNPPTLTRDGRGINRAVLPACPDACLPARRERGRILLPRCEFSTAVREYARVPVGEDVYFWYRARLAWWATLWERRLMYSVEFRFVLASGEVG